MTVLFVSYADWANMGQTLAECLQSVEVQALAITLHSLRGEWPRKSRAVVPAVARRLARSADTIVWMHSRYTPVPTEGKKLLVFHGGSEFRLRTEKALKMFNPIADVSLVQTGELLGRGAKNEVWLLPAVDTKHIKPKFSVHQELVFAHYPSNGPKDREIKGSSVINAVMQNLSGGFEYRFQHRPQPVVPWAEYMKMIADCDVYIESLSHGSATWNKHDWSITALEAAALGKIVVTNFTTLERYGKEYGECALMVANTGEELRVVVEDILTWSGTEVLHKQAETRLWVEKLHSYKAVGSRLKKIIEGICTKQ